MDSEFLQWSITAAAVLGAGLGSYRFGRRNGRRGNPHSLTSIDRENIRQAMEIVAGDASRDIVRAIEKDGDETRVAIRELAESLRKKNRDHRT